MLWLIIIVALLILGYKINKSRKKELYEENKHYKPQKTSIPRKQTWILLVCRYQYPEYMMESYSVPLLLGTLLPYFEGENSPHPPWNLVLVFNEEYIYIKPEFFTKEGFISDEFIKKLNNAEPGWSTTKKLNSYTCYDIKNKKTIPLHSKFVESSLGCNVDEMQKYLEETLKQMKNNVDEEETFSDVLSMVFKGKI